jgi:hypothetical protein
MMADNAFEQGKDKVAKLSRFFATNRQNFLRDNEAQVRQSLIDPLFEALGWDVSNKALTAPQYREVIPEDSVEVEGHQKNPDYTFRVGTLPKFYAEAKKCTVNLGSDPAPAFQLRRYGFSGKLALSILTSFGELSVYDCTARPYLTDKASHSRIDYFHADEYPDRWRELWDVFSRDAVWSGAFDQYADSKRKRGTSEVDSEFLREMEGWREALARNIALRNADISPDDLNAAVQSTIDRVVFLRMAEDRALEPYEQLFKLSESPDIYRRFMHETCRRADEKYNSGLFHFQKESGVSDPPDRITPKLAVDDRVFKPILQSLYFAYGSPYAFGVMPVEILGTIYERFLGNVIRLTAGHQAKVEEKPEVRKAGGVYYTPAAVVQHIVKHTVGTLIEARSPAQLAGGKKATFRAMDMACGSGSFLLGAYQCLLDHCLRWYTEHKPETLKRAVYKDPRNGQWRLTIEEKKRILTTHIFGVDIDPQAVEVTKLSLLLKVLEGESDQSISLSQLNFGDRALPNLAENIKCGNSLIEPDYFTGKLIYDQDEMRRINAFDWKQGFPEAMKAGGFDCIIGNPPWGADITSSEIAYFKAAYSVAKASILDSYALFLERGTQRLCPNGYLGFITPDTFLRKNELLPIRRLMLQDTTIHQLIETGPLFSQVRDTWCLISILSNARAARAHKISHMKISRFVTAAEDRLTLFSRGKWDSQSQVAQHVWRHKQGLIVGYLATERCQEIVEKMERLPSLGELSDAFRISRGEEGSKFAISAYAAGKFFMVLPQDVERHTVKEGVRIAGATLTHTKVDALYSHPKIWVIRIQKMRWRQRIVCAFDGRKNSAGMKTLQIIVSINDDTQSLKYLSAVLASRLINFWCVNYLADDMNQSYLERIPVPAINTLAKGIVEKAASFTDRLSALHLQLASARSAAQKTVIQRQIESADSAIDRLVYELYGLSEKEVELVEADHKSPEAYYEKEQTQIAAS